VNINNLKNVKLILKIVKLCGMLSQWLIININNGKELFGKELMPIHYLKKTKFYKLNSKTLKRSKTLEVIHPSLIKLKI